MYAQLGAGIYASQGLTYWDCMEHYKDGTKNDEGAKRRKKMKVVMLALTYGMGANTLAESVGCSKEEAQKILADFKTGFPVAEQWMRKTEIEAASKGYVEDYWGRRRRLPDLKLDNYDVFYSDKKSLDFNPILGSKGVYKYNNTKRLQEIRMALNAAHYRKEKQRIIDDAIKSNIIVEDNTGLIATAKRKSVNARVQGCLDGNTKLITPDGIRTIKSLVNTSVQIWDGNDWTSANILYSGKKRKCILRLINDTEIICSPDHLFLSEFQDLNIRSKTSHFNKTMGDEYYDFMPFETDSKPIEDLNVEEPTFRKLKDLTLNTKVICSGRLPKSEYFEKVITKLKEYFSQDDTTICVGDNVWLLKDKSIIEDCDLKVHQLLQLLGIQSNGKSYNKIKRKTVYTYSKKKIETFNYYYHDENLSQYIDSIKITNDYIDMYDVCDTERGYFVANGIITHNSAATMTKKAMIDIDSDKEMKELGFSLLIGVHDELIGECPAENAEKVAERLTYLMRNCVPELDVPFKCDAEIEPAWYYNTYVAALKKEFTQIQKDSNLSAEDAFLVLANNHEENDKETLKYMLTLDI